MPPYNPKSLAGLTNAGKGRSREGRKQYGITLHPELVEQVDKLAKQKGWKRNQTIEYLLELALEKRF